MSITTINFANTEIIYLDLEGVYNTENQISQIKDINRFLEKSETPRLILINLSGFMPGPGFMEFATKTINLRATKVKKAAYFGLEKQNHNVYKYYDKFNSEIIKRENFKTKIEAIEWLIDTNS